MGPRLRESDLLAPPGHSAWFAQPRLHIVTPLSNDESSSAPAFCFKAHLFDMLDFKMPLKMLPSFRVAIGYCQWKEVRCVVHSLRVLLAVPARLEELGERDGEWVEFCVRSWSIGGKGREKECERRSCRC